jgi:hypothetical protein
MAGDYKVLFTYSCVAFLLALFCLLFVRHGEESQTAVNVTEILENLDD